jgi:hypothetical protein
MEIGKIFTNSIVREIVRSYGKTESNSLLRGRHSISIRLVALKAFTTLQIEKY